MKFLLVIAAVFLWSDSIGQIQPKPNSNFLQIDMGLSTHATGDMPGYGLNVSYRKYWRKNIHFAFGVGMTMHSGVFPIYYSDDMGNQVDASYRYGSGGLQLSGKFGISVYRNSKNDLGLQVGTIGRYQTSSYYDEINVLYPNLTGLPIPVTAIINKSNQKTISIGGIGQVYYNYFINEKVFIGFTPILQIDSEGNIISQLMLSSGFRL